MFAGDGLQKTPATSTATRRRIPLPGIDGSDRRSRARYAIADAHVVHIVHIVDGAVKHALEG